MILDAYNNAEKTDFAVIVALFAFSALPLFFSRITSLPGWYILAQFSGRLFYDYVKDPNTGRDVKIQRVGNANNKWKVNLLPPPAIFGIVWSALHVTTPLAVYFYWHDFNSKHTDYYGWSLFLYMLCVAFECGWGLFFWGASTNFDVERPMIVVAFFVVLLNFTASLTLLIFWIIDEAWASFGLIIPYVLWLLLALYLNGQFVRLAYWLGGEDDFFYGTNAMEEYNRICNGFFYRINPYGYIYGIQNDKPPLVGVTGVDDRRGVQAQVPAYNDKGSPLAGGYFSFTAATATSDKRK